MRLLLLFICPAVAYVVLGVNLRALAKGWMLLTAGTEFAYALMSFYIIHRVAEASSFVESLAFASGAVIGTLASIKLTRHWDR